MKTAKELEEMFDVTPEEIEKLAAPWEAGELAGKPKGEIVVGRPLMFGESLKPVGFKETEYKIDAIDHRASQLGMKRSEYLRHLVDEDLKTAGIL